MFSIGIFLVLKGSTSYIWVSTVFGIYVSNVGRLSSVCRLVNS